jgi:ribosomal protein S18 acetylase RimI-like enzyme
MASETRVREATVGDAAALHMLAVDLADALSDRRPAAEAVRERLSELLAEGRAWVIVAEDSEAGVVGAATAWVKPDLAHGDRVVEVPMLVVSSGARRRGVGRLLVEEIRTIASAQDAALIELVATSDNAAAREFYRSLGFVETDHVALEFVGDTDDPPGPEG